MWFFSRSASIFQPTHPAGGATATERRSEAIWIISTHAPRGGCDSKREQIPERNMHRLHKTEQEC